MNLSTRSASVAAAGLIGLSVVTACSSSSQPDASSSSGASMSGSSSAGPASPAGGGSASATATSATAVITIKDYSFNGAKSVTAGARVTVKNDDSEAHTVTSDSAGAFDVKVDPGRSTTFTAPARAGSFPYHCSYHGNMHGTLKVR